MQLFQRSAHGIRQTSLEVCESLKCQPGSLLTNLPVQLHVECYLEAHQLPHFSTLVKTPDTEYISRASRGPAAMLFVGRTAATEVAMFSPQENLTCGAPLKVEQQLDCH